MNNRNEHLENLHTKTFDTLVIGGGVNGAVCAAALAGQGITTALIDKRDFAGFTSQQSSNLAWGGIKYMETYEFRLVRNLCTSRNELIKSFPSSVKEIRFLTTINKGFRFHPLFMWAGTWLYWLMGNGFTQMPRLLSKNKIAKEEPNVKTAQSIGGFEYSDAYLIDNDARFVFNFIRNALDSGCTIANYTTAHQSVRKNGIWETEVTDLETGNSYTVKSKTLINAAGPFADGYNQQNNIETEHHHLFSKGIHLIVDAVTENPRVLAFFASDGRLFFVIPMGDKTCIGTTDNKVDSPITEVTPADRQFVLDNANDFLKFDTPITEKDIISERCGVRPLAIKGKKDLKGDFLELSRKHAVDVNYDKSQLTIFGGKTTDCLNVGREIYDYIKQMGVTNGQANNEWFGESGDVEKQRVFSRTDQVMATTINSTQARTKLADRLWRRYDKGTHSILNAIEGSAEKAKVMISNTDITVAELEYVRDNEMVVKLEDFLRRRSLIALTKGRSNLAESGELFAVSSLLFGESQAQIKVDEYLMPAQHSHAEKSLQTG